jgi:hypothetical protein
MDRNQTAMGLPPVTAVFLSSVSEEEELNGSTVSALGIRSRKLSNVLNGQS